MIRQLIKQKDLFVYGFCAHYLRRTHGTTQPRQWQLFCDTVLERFYCNLIFSFTFDPGRRDAISVTVIIRIVLRFHYVHYTNTIVAWYLPSVFRLWHNIKRNETVKKLNGSVDSKLSCLLIRWILFFFNWRINTYLLFLFHIIYEIYWIEYKIETVHL
jgi:hypothetical protein